MTNAAREKLIAEILHKDRDALRKLETWGLSLFLGAIALLTKQLREWGTPSSPLPTWELLAPAAIGLTAFVFLRIVNAHSYKATKRLWMVTGAWQPGAGGLGWLFALMPVILGWAGTWLLVPIESASAVLGIALAVSVALVLAFLGFDERLRGESARGVGRVAVLPVADIERLRRGEVVEGVGRDVVVVLPEEEPEPHA